METINRNLRDSNKQISPLSATLETPFTVILAPARTKIIEEIVILHLIDSPAEKMVSVKLKGISKEIVLWKDEDYDNIGQWTDTDAINRIKELFTN
jgi:hypothetical protein